MHNSLTLKRQGYLLTNKYIHYICADKINAMIKTNLFLLLFVLLAGTSCNRQQHFISDDTFRAEVENDFRAKQAALPDGNLFSVFNQKMASDEKEALTCMPICRSEISRIMTGNCISTISAVRFVHGWKCLGETAYRKTSSAISYFPCGSTTRIWTRAAWSFMKN